MEQLLSVEGLWQSSVIRRQAASLAADDSEDGGKRWRSDKRSADRAHKEMVLAWEDGPVPLARPSWKNAR